MTAQTTATARSIPLRSPVTKPAARRTPSLRLVPQRRSSAAKAPFVVVVVALLAGGLLGLLLLNTLVAQESFALHDLNKQGKALEQREQELGRQVQALQAPAALAAQAQHLGMVPGGPPAFLRLADGRVLGKPMPGVAPPPPVTASTTWTAPRKPAPVTKAAAPTAPAATTATAGPGTAATAGTAAVKPAVPPTTGAAR